MPLPSVKNLRKILSLYNDFFKIKGIHRMRKSQLMAAIARKRYICYVAVDGTLELRPKPNTPAARLPLFKYKGVSTRRK